MNNITATWSKTSQKLTALLLLWIASYWFNLCLHVAVFGAVYWSFQTSIPMAKQALKSSHLHNPLFIPNKIYRNLLLFFLGLYWLAVIYLPADVAGFIALGIGLMFIAKLKEWHYWVLLRHRNILFYYLIQLLCAAAYLYLGYQHILQTPPNSLADWLIAGYVWGVMGLMYSTSAHQNLK